ncbi:hypothetical protein ABMC88_12890 [Sulfitobacter sp. HNIBRBA2951]|uniref:hypothetical protein n=1 Tax=Sulfitobacter aquimarinus TaxID=3158557 RepID=UPI0032DE7BB7
MDNISTHGEQAIGTARLGQNDKDAPVRVGVFAWLLMALLAGMFCGEIASAFGIVEHYGKLMVVLQLTALVLAVLLVLALKAQTRKQREAYEKEIREIAQAERDRKMDAFIQEQKGFAPKRNR